VSRARESVLGPLLALAIVIVLALPAPVLAQRPGQGEDESAAFVEVGRAALKKGELGDAARALDQALALNPRRVEAYVLRSAVHAARKQYKEGIALMRRAQALAPTDADVLTALGSHLVLSGEVAEGVPLLAQVVSGQPARYDAQLLLGIHWHRSGKWPDAIAALEAYFQHRPGELAREDATYRIELADSYLRYRDPRRARALFEQAAKARPGDLRARIGVAWATAALDCKQARPLLRALEPAAKEFPEVWLVDGQCALALGDVTGALALGRRYLDRTARATGAARPATSAAAGHALVGEAHAARGNLVEARRALEDARRLDPERRRWPVRLAFVLRRAKQTADALVVLEELGPPASPGIDPDWWSELGESLLAQGEPARVVERLAAVVPELTSHAPARTVLGHALLQVGNAEGAVKILDEAEAIASTARSRRLLAAALAAVAFNKLQAQDATAAEVLLVRADALDGNPVVWRNLGIARLALGKAAEAAPVLERAAKADSSPILAMLVGRARALAGDVAGARPFYERALAAEKDNPLEIALDWAASELAGGDPAVAVTALEKTAAAARSGPYAARHRAALSTARHAAGLAQLRAGNGGKAVELLRAAAVPGETNVARKCDLAVASVAAPDAAAALTALRAITGQSCPFPPPADTQAAPILVAFTEGLNPKQARRSLDRLTALGGKSSGPAATLLGTAIRVVALNAAQDAYRSGQLGPARKYLAAARGANARVGADEVAHNLAVLDLADGKLDAAIAQFERLATKVPEALVNLGIAYERKGDHARALDAWRRARRANVRFAPLADWIDAKERIHGEAP
jgi:tetratricopeptide (TPR) repeat protein